MISKIFSLTNIFGRRNSLIFLFVFFFSIISSFFEVIGIGLLAIFAILINDPAIILEKIFFINLKNYLEQLEKIDLVVLCSVAILVVFIIKHFIFFFTNYIEIKIIKKISLNIKEKIYKFYLSKNYENFINNNKSDLINTIASQTSSFMGYMHNVFLIIKELILISIIFTGIVIIDWKVILSLTFILFLLTFSFVKFFKKKLNNLGEKARTLQEAEIKHLDETYQSFKLIKLANKENFFLNLLNAINKKKNYYEISHFLIGKIPKIFLEIIVIFLFIGTVLIFISKDPNNGTSFGTITFFAFAIIRIMPAFISLNNAYTGLAFFRSPFEIIYKMISNISPTQIKLSQNEFNQNLNEIEVNNLHFSYINPKKTILKNINFKIKRGDILGIIGPSGSGKSTLLHLILGLLNPTKGKILFDKIEAEKNLNYKKNKISYIPQDDFILNATLKENIAFGEKNIDQNKVKDSLSLSNLSDLSDNVQINVGESGSKFSHGQKQRISLARAHYADNQLLILDESLNALDKENESSLLKKITQLKNKILIFVAHRTETLRFCNKLLIIKDGEIVDFGETNKILKKHSNLKKYFELNNETN